MKNSQEIPKKWCILRTEENYKEVNEWFEKVSHMKFDATSGFIYYPIEDVNYNLSDYFNLNTLPKNHNDFTEITTEQFREWFLKDEKPTPDKKIIGYKFKEEYKKFKNAAECIKGSSINNDKGKDYFTIDLLFIERFKESGVLDIWFEPVFEEEQDKTSTSPDLSKFEQKAFKEPCKNPTDSTLVEEPKWKTLCDMLAEELGYNKHKTSVVCDYYYNIKNEKCYIATKRGLKRVK